MNNSLEKTKILIISPSSAAECASYIAYIEDYCNVLVEFEDSTYFFDNLINNNKNSSQISKVIGLLTGGADVDPTLYGQPYHPSTYSDKDRDNKEISFLERCISFDIKVLGFCRGAQLLTVFNGGTLIQDVDGHMLSHEIDIEGYSKRYEITSDHHQMMNPYKSRLSSYRIIAWASCNLSSYYKNGSNKEVKLPDPYVEPEIVYYTKMKSLAIQGHPEYSHCEVSTKKVIGNIIKKELIQ